MSGDEDILGSVQLEVETLVSGRQATDPRLYNAVLLLNRQLELITQRLSPLVRKAIEVERGISALAAPTSFICFSTGTTVRFTWDQVTYASQYEVREGDDWNTALFRFRTTGLQGDIDPLLYGNYNFLIKTVDPDGNYSVDANPTTFQVPQIPAPVVSVSVIDNNVLLSWTEPTSIFKIDYYLVEKRGDNPVTGKVNGTFTSIFEIVGGSYTYAVTAVDIAGNTGTDAEIEALVNQPPDFALQESRTSDLMGARVNVLRIPVRPSLLCCWNAQTWHEHFQRGNGIGGITYRDIVIADGATNYWRLDELSGTTVADQIGGATGTITGGVTLNQTGALPDGNKAVTFDSTGKIVTTASVTVPVSCTFEAWIKTSTSHVNLPVVSINAVSSLVLYETSGQLAIYDQFNSNQNLIAPVAFTSDVWHLAAWVFDGSTIKFYIDGALINSQSCIRTSPAIGQVGIGWTSYADLHWLDFIDEVAIYPTALTPTQIANHYSARSGGMVWMDIEDQITAGYPIYIQPSYLTGSYTEIVDFGTVINNTIITTTWNSIIYTPLFTMNIVVKMAVSNDGITYTPLSEGSSQYFRQLRYLKLELHFTAENDKTFIELYNLTINLNVKRENDGGEVNALASDIGGTTVYFTKPFKDIESITCTTKSTIEPYLVIFDFADIPNPVSFKVFVFDTMGARVTKVVDWKARGIV